MSQWYIENFPLSDIAAVNCLNCSNHSPPSFIDTDECVFCIPMDAHVLCSKALECTSFTPFITNLDADIAKKQKPTTDAASTNDIVSLAEFFGLAEEISEGLKELDVSAEQKKEKDESAAEWKPNSELSAFDFNEEAVLAALRTMFDILKSIDKRLTKIEDKIPTTKNWKIKDYFKTKKKNISILKVKYKWRIKTKIRNAKSKANKKKTGFEALFSPSKKEMEKKDNEEKKNEKTT